VTSTRKKSPTQGIDILSFFCDSNFMLKILCIGYLLLAATFADAQCVDCPEGTRVNDQYQRDCYGHYEFRRNGDGRQLPDPDCDCAIQCDAGCPNQCNKRVDCPCDPNRQWNFTVVSSVDGHRYRIGMSDPSILYLPDDVNGDPNTSWHGTFYVTGGGGGNFGLYRS